MASKRALSTLATSLERLAISRATSSSTFSPLVRVQRLSLSSSRPPRPQPCMPLRQPKRHFTTTLVRRKDDSDSNSQSRSKSTVYAMSDIQSLITSSKPDPHRILVDVREPSELQSTGKIPGSQNLPIKSAPDAFFLGPEEFEERFGWQKPGPNDEVIFYCKAGVRSRAAAQLAGQAGFGGKIGEFPGSWVEWEGKGGEVEREK
ncbi:Thiosulfate sulfurtransferase rdl2, mitochondrial [Exophiala xenobiotica]|nr:Thiosulfate sulfurtransferase rdl2, mitochondrial [Exophiala xenobiotica]KAK5207082.1 Thiosulfate sulfurtransferase rdl2, mitochondrial [Exophiala xenobiotica]KAK5227476.1 Thiosulfate sulfurtransferase rdl2, mitochondrial [Exophiala xenobiotica]KAK5251824.1 Thiosulfate sulfurtransferase rdl2, mitochondrial [Exophiala xenobiotica]KAK5261672.1 Thiosulfate sulfurtransferase rdl2, mitochondrial [Exophiala xenobiotica]